MLMAIAGAFESRWPTRVFLAIAPLALTAGIWGSVSTPAGGVSRAVIPGRSTKPTIPPNKKTTQTKLEQIASSAQSESKATFKLTYSWKESTTSGEVTLEQKPPDQAFSTGAGKVVSNGQKTYYCSTASSPVICVKYGSATSSPLGSVLRVYSSAFYVSEIKDWQNLVTAGISGYKASFSTATFAGQPSQCVSWSYKSENAKYCVTDKGILAFVGGTSSSKTYTFTLTNFSTNVSTSDFSVPKGAKIVSVP
jgi:hypothetical protein